MSAYAIPLLHLPGTAGADLSAAQYFAVKYNGSGAFILAGAGEGIGLLQNDPESGEAASVMVNGVSRAKLGGTVSEGDPLTTDSAGKLVRHDGQGAVLGTVLADGVADDLAPVLLAGGAGAGGGLRISAVVGAEAADVIEVACTVVRDDGTAVDAATLVHIQSLPDTPDQGDIAAAGSPIGTVEVIDNPATGENNAYFSTTAAGLVSFGITNTAAESNMLKITPDGGASLILKLTFA